MNPDQLKASREEGRKVWEALQAQMAEGNGFLGAMFKSFRLFVRRHFLSFLIYGIVAAMVSAGLWYIKPRVFEAEMTVSYVHYEKKIYADMLRKLDQLVNTNDYRTLARLLDLPEDSVKKIRYVGGFNIRNEDLTGDLSTEKIPFYIKVRVTDLGILAQLQKALVNYLNNTEFIQQRLDYMRRKSLDDLTFLNHRLAIADSLSSILIIPTESMKDEKAITRMELLQEAMTLHDKIESVKGSLEFNQNIEVLDGFVPTEKSVGKGMRYWIFYGFLAGLGVRFLVLIFR